MKPKKIADECLGELISDSDDEGETYQERDVNIYKNMYDLIFELKKELDDHKSSLDNSLTHNEELRLENLSLKQENTSSACLYVISKENEDLKLFNMSADVIIKELKEKLKYKEEELEQISDFNEAHRKKADELEEENEKLKETIEKYKERYGGLSL